MSAREDENRRLLRARDAIDRHHARRLDVDELARIAVMSSAHFSRRFCALFGETPHRYLQRRRIERACAALRSGRTVTDTAFAVGYDSVGTFSRTFTAIVGCTPTAYRRAAAPIPVPGCVVRDWTRPATGLRSFFRCAHRRGARSVVIMITSVAIHSIFVLDHQEALDFYVGALGFEVSSDVDMGFMRWLTIAPPAQSDREILLTVPGPPATTPQAAEAIRDLLTQGALGTAAILGTDDCRATYADLVAKGVEFTQEPQEQPYGIDCALRDPFGNHIRITERTDERPVDDRDIRRWSAS